MLKVTRNTGANKRVQSNKGNLSSWSTVAAEKLYQIPRWGEGYFEINALGHMQVRPGASDDSGIIDLRLLADHCHAQGLNFPVLVRFNDILHHRRENLCRAFQLAMQKYDWKGQYKAIYPIKVNQQKSVISQILAQGGTLVGLEAGSKPELIAVLALIPAGGSVICNGYKDKEYLRLALIGKALGNDVYIVIEKPSELLLLLKEAELLDIAPIIGVRIRLASVGKGKWQNTGGDKSKFGLSVTQLLQMIDVLEDKNQLQYLRLLHFHLGSQIAGLEDIRRGILECAQVYAEIRKMGVDIQTVDVGGGLGVDYDGSGSRNFCSVDYDMDEYAETIISVFKQVCEQNQVDHPQIFTESGRAMTAHHAMLMVNVIDVERAVTEEKILFPDSAELKPLFLLGTQIEKHIDMGIGWSDVSAMYQEFTHLLENLQKKYRNAGLSLKERAAAENFFIQTNAKLRDYLQQQGKPDKLLDTLNEKLADKYFCNFSLFQSLPDIWAIEQIFPVVPLQNLQEYPEHRAILQDITCDSDGQIDCYGSEGTIGHSLPVHKIKVGDQDYLLGIFLTGAYQETLGDRHNLFGRTDSVHVSLNVGETGSESGEESYHLEKIYPGETVSDVLEAVNFSVEEFRRIFSEKILASQIPEASRYHYLCELEAGLTGYTYLE